MNTAVLAGLCVLLVVILKPILTKLFQVYRIWSAVAKIPGPKAHWLYGNAKDIGEPHEYLQNLVELAKKYPGMHPIWYGPLNVVLMIHDPAIVKILMKSPTTKENPAHLFMKDWLGSGILLNNGEHWFRNRRLLTPAFHFDILKGYMKVFNQCTNVLIDKWAKESESDKPFELLKDMSLCTFDVILQCACSLSIDPQRSGAKHNFVKVSRQNLQLIESRFTNVLYQNSFIYGLTADGRQFYANTKFSRDFARNVIVKRKKALESGEADISGKKHLDFLDIMLSAKDADGKGMSIDEMVKEVITFLFAGHDTTSTSLCWILYSLAKFPEHQTKCWKEIDEVMGDKTDIEWEDLAALKYTTLCIKESLRMHTTVPLFGLTLGEDLVVNGVSLPKGLDVEIASYVYHLKPELWEDPLTFNPLRFTPENSEKRDAYNYTPFRVGPRNCIGQNFALQELKTVTAKVLKRFEVILEDQTPYVHSIESILKKHGGFWLKLKERA